MLSWSVCHAKNDDFHTKDDSHSTKNDEIYTKSDDIYTTNNNIYTKNDDIYTKEWWVPCLTMMKIDDNAIKGITSQTQLNGKRGWVMAFCTENGGLCTENHACRARRVMDFDNRTGRYVIDVNGQHVALQVRFSTDFRLMFDRCSSDFRVIFESSWLISILSRLMLVYFGRLMLVYFGRLMLVYFGRLMLVYFGRLMLVTLVD